MSEFTHFRKAEAEGPSGLSATTLGAQRQHLEFWLSLDHVDIGPKSYISSCSRPMSESGECQTSALWITMSGVRRLADVYAASM